MDSLKVIESDIVPVYETSSGNKVVYGTELYKCLGSKRQYTDWIKERFSDCDAIENKDFESFSQKNEKGGRPKKEHIIKLNIAKEMAMLERNKKGKEVRRYFIKVEEKYKEEKSMPLTLQQQIQTIAKGTDELYQRIDELDAKIENSLSDLPLLGVEETKISNAVKRKGVEVLGGKQSNAYKDRSIVNAVYRDIYGQIYREFDINTYKAIKRNQCDIALNIIEGYKLPLALKKRIDNVNAQQSLNLEGGVQ